MNRHNYFITIVTLERKNGSEIICFSNLLFPVNRKADRCLAAKVTKLNCIAQQIKASTVTYSLGTNPSSSHKPFILLRYLQGHWSPVLITKQENKDTRYTSSNKSIPNTIPPRNCRPLNRTRVKKTWKGDVS